MIMKSVQQISFKIIYINIDEKRTINKEKYLGLQQNKKIFTWEIDWISNDVNILISNAHKNLTWLSGRRFFMIKIDKLMRNPVLH